MRTSLRSALSVSLSLSMLSLPLTAGAALLDPSDPYGYHPRSMGTARATAPFARDFSATLTNPASLAHEGTSEMSLGYLYASPSLSLNNQSVGSTANQMPLIGMRLNLGPMTKLENKIAFGLAIGLDDNAQGLLSLNDSPSAQGQFVRSGQRQLLLSGGLGIEVLPKVKIGAGILLGISANANMSLQTSLAGDTSRESMAMDVSPRFAPVLGLAIGPWEVGPFRDVAFAASYRAASYQSVRVNALADARLGESPLTTLPLNLTFIDAYRPEDLSVGFQMGMGIVTANVAIDYARWSRLGGVLAAEDSVRQSAGLTFRDVVSPRLGAEVALPANLTARAGYAFEPSPLNDAPPSALNAIDNTRHVFSLGAGFTLPANASIFSQPLSVDAAYQLHQLSERNFTLVTGEASTLNALAAGRIHALSVSLTLRF